MSIDDATPTKGQTRKLNALRKRVGDNIAEGAFAKWMARQSKAVKAVRGPVAGALVVAVAGLQDKKSFRLGRKGYLVRRAKGRGGPGFVAEKVA